MFIAGCSSRVLQRLSTPVVLAPRSRHLPCAADRAQQLRAGQPARFKHSTGITLRGRNAGAHLLVGTKLEAEPFWPCFFDFDRNQTACILTHLHSLGFEGVCNHLWMQRDPADKDAVGVARDREEMLHTMLDVLAVHSRHSIQVTLHKLLQN